MVFFGFFFYKFDSLIFLFNIFIISERLPPQKKPHQKTKNKPKTKQNKKPKQTKRNNIFLVKVILTIGNSSMIEIIVAYLSKRRNT